MNWDLQGNTDTLMLVLGAGLAQQCVCVCVFVVMITWSHCSYSTFIWLLLDLWGIRADRVHSRLHLHHVGWCHFRYVVQRSPEFTVHCALIGPQLCPVKVLRHTDEPSVLYAQCLESHCSVVTGTLSPQAMLESRCLVMLSSWWMLKKWTTLHRTVKERSERLQMTH